jgi:hypothetical protein
MASRRRGRRVQAPEANESAIADLVIASCTGFSASIAQFNSFSRAVARNILSGTAAIDRAALNLEPAAETYLREVTSGRL